MALLDLNWVMLRWFLFFVWIAGGDSHGKRHSPWPRPPQSAPGRLVPFVTLISWLGTIGYLISRSDPMVVRHTKANAAKARSTRAYEPQTVRYSDADRLAALGRRREAGLVTGMDFDTRKARILG